MRQSGILLHITSLPSRFGIGDLGPEAYSFLEFLKASGQSVWQVLPTHPTHSICDNCPYASDSVFAGNTLFISPEVLLNEGLLNSSDLESAPEFSTESIDFENVIPYKQSLLEKAFTRFKPDGEYEQFLKDAEGWLKDYALFVVLKRHHGGKAWSDWKEGYRYRHPETLHQFHEENREAMDQIYFEQFYFYKQWQALRVKAQEFHISLMGDIPIYVNYDSADVWTHPDVFQLNDQGQMDVVAGVPPDYFSATGQRWGNPVYDWAFLQKTHFAWWITRLKHILSLCDILRIDHFRAFVNYWEIPEEEDSAINGHWAKVPTDAFFTEVKKQLGSASIVAEDLGLIDPPIFKKIHSLGYPGMKILLFAFGDDLKKHMYLPHNYKENCVVYTGTHDNNTVKGWFEDDATKKEKENFLKYIQQEQPEAVHLEMIQLALASKAKLALFPMQDVLGLGSSARMNVPGTTAKNWRWRVQKNQLNACVSKRLLEQTSNARRSVI